MRIVAAVLIILVNPFGFADATSEHTEAILSRWAAPLYGTTGQGRVSAIVIDDDAAEKLSGGYPVTFEAHARVLRRIMCLDPAAVFIDLNFRYLRGDEQGLAALAEAMRYRSGPDGCAPRSRAELARNDRSPVYLAVVRNPNSRCPSIIEAGEHCVSMRALQPLIEAATPIDVTGLLSNGRYRMATPRPDGKIESTPSVRLADAVCRRQPNASTHCGSNREEPAPPLVVRWGHYLSPLTASRYDAGACEGPAADQVSESERRIRAMGSLFRSLLALGPTPSQPCVYSDHVAADRLLRPDVNSSTFLHDLIKDRAVVYGADITALPDRIVSPVHGSLPGLFVHAMAADNLLTLGDRYWRDPPPIGLGLDLGHLFEIALTCVLFIGMAYFSASYGLRGALLFSLAFTVVVVLSAIAVVWFLSFAPPNFVMLIIFNLIDALLGEFSGKSRAMGAGIGEDQATINRTT